MLNHLYFVSLISIRCFCYSVHLATVALVYPVISAYVDNYLGRYLLNFFCEIQCLSLYLQTVDIFHFKSYLATTAINYV